MAFYGRGCAGHVRMLETRYAGPTDRSGARIIVRNVTSGKRTVHGYAHERDALGAHVQAAHEHMRRAYVPESEPYVLVPTSTDRGYIFAVICTETVSDLIATDSPVIPESGID